MLQATHLGHGVPQQRFPTGCPMHLVAPKGLQIGMRCARIPTSELIAMLATLLAAFRALVVPVVTVIPADNANLALGLFARPEAKRSYAHDLPVAGGIALDNATVPVR